MSFVAGAGSVNIDLFYSGLPRVPGEGEEIYSEGFSVQIGGGVPATMANLGRLGVPTRIQTSLGSDMFSDFARRSFQEAGVTPVQLGDGTGMPLIVSTTMLTPSDRTFVSYTGRGPITDEMREQVYEHSKGAKLVEMQLDYLDVYKKLHAEGTKLVFDTGWDDDMSIEKYREFLEIADYYTPNQKEALKITGADTPEAAAEVLSDFFEHVIVKLDADGCLIREQGKNHVVPSITEFAYRDSTGAGDAFLAGLLYGLYHEYTFAESVLFGNITGGKCITGVGCLAETCTEDELLALWAKYQHFL